MTLDCCNWCYKSSTFTIGSNEVAAMIDPIDTNISIIILCKEERENLEMLLPVVKEQLDSLRYKYEIIIVDGKSVDGSAEVGLKYGARVISQLHEGYGEAFRLGIGSSKGDFILTLDADLSHPTPLMEYLLEMPPRYGLVIGSRYIIGGQAEMPTSRRMLSQFLNLLVRLCFKLKVYDCSSGYRRYSSIIRSIPLQADRFDILIESIVKLERQNVQIIEVPFRYLNRNTGISKVRLYSFAVSYMKTLKNLLTSKR